MITKDKLTALLHYFEFAEVNGIYKREYPHGASIEVNIKTQKIKYSPLDNSFKEGEFPSKKKTAKGFVFHRKVTLDFSHNENFVCLVCVHLLLKKGYEPKHIVFEPAFEVGHVNKPSFGDILVFDKEYNPLVLIENKTYGTEFSSEWNKMLKNGGQLFSYLGPLVRDLGLCENLVLFAADFEDKIVTKSHIIKLKDNEKRIKELENPLSFSNTQGKFFEVWDQTYGKTFETKGLFEDDIAAYSVGKLKYTIRDLKGLSHAEIRPIYHEFATILRNHAITDFEHSFYILIDLFLCKITDERNNPDNLQFYYKGITRDTPKEYCARLLDLYQLGKKQLFDVDVVNKKESDISQIFEDKNRTKNGLYEGIRELFEEIKFYNIKKFNFIDVENKDDFELNFQILIEIAALIQDVNLSSSETNHFFGDLFEGLLSKNVHQTEGQFFTPLPIVNFIIKSLPQFTNTGDLKVLDYACGAGHFLTEFLKTYPKAQAYGIEKSQPLSQVAKIATIINGAKEESHIVFKDALSGFNTAEVRFQGFDKESFDCIIANPPYSVKGFLNTLTESEREQFSLIKYVESKAYETNNSIECFFIERTKHFLKPNGLVGIVLPSSILSNGNLYTKTRELLFANFNILAIVDLNSRTFGSTGTNTIVLFAQRVKKNAEGLIETFVNKNEYTSYTNYLAIESYLHKQNYDRDEYFAFIQDDILSENLEGHDVFREYKKKFKIKSVSKAKQKMWFGECPMCPKDSKENSNKYKDGFTRYLASEEYKMREAEEYKNQFIHYSKEIELDKLKTYVQIANDELVVLLSPPDKVGSKSNKQQIVKFLGYDWSNRKGDEGIKYVTNKPASKSDGKNGEKQEKDDEIVEAINSIRYIDTPLYNPNDEWNSHKFAYAIRKHIYQHIRKQSCIQENKKNLEVDFVGEMDELLSYAKLSDLVDFSRAEFDKSIKLTADKKIDIESKYPLAKLGGDDGVCDIKIGGTPSRKNMAYFTGKNPWVSISELNGQVITDTKEKISDAGVRDSNVKLIPKGTTLLGFKLSIGKTAIAGVDLYTNEAIAALIPKDKNVILDEYLFALFNGRMIDLDNVGNKAFGKSLNSTYLKNEIKIPLPPIDIQKQIITECKKVDKEFNRSRMSIEEYKKKIAKVFESFEVVIKRG